jgi:hypothetical protein
LRLFIVPFLHVLDELTFFVVQDDDGRLDFLIILFRWVLDEIAFFAPPFDPL